MAHFEGLGYEHGDHGLEAEFFKFRDVPFVLQAREDAGEVLGAVGDFGAKGGFAADEGGSVGQGEVVSVVVLGVAKAGDKVVDVPDELVSDFAISQGISN